MIKDREILLVSHKDNTINNQKEEIHLTTKEEIKREIDIINHIDLHHNSKHNQAIQDIHSLYTEQELQKVLQELHVKLHKLA